MKALTVYTEKRQALQDFKEKHQNVFAQADALQVELAEAEAALKMEVREAGKSMENDVLAVVFTQAFKEYYDYKVISRVAKPEEKTLIDQKAINVDVDKKKFQALVKTGAISMDVERKSFKREELTPRVSIKEKTNDEA